MNSLLCKWGLINQSVSINWLPKCWATLTPCLARLVSQIDWRLVCISADTSLRIDKSCVSYCAATLSIRRGHCKWAVTNGLITDWMRSKGGGDTEIAKWTAWMQHLHPCSPSHSLSQCLLTCRSPSSTVSLCLPVLRPFLAASFMRGWQFKPSGKRQVAVKASRKSIRLQRHCQL